MALPAPLLRHVRPSLLVPSVLATALLLTGCGDGADSGGGADAGDDRVDVVAAFYPLAYLADRIGGDRVSVTNLTRPGVEPHDLELAPDQVARVGDADLVLVLDGFQPAVDGAIDGAGDTDRVVDVAADARLVDGDPHFWLDLDRFAEVATLVGDRLAAVDPPNAGAYRSATASLVADLRSLDTEFETALATCESRDLVTSHEAFGYLAARYDLRQRGIAGIRPDAEPSPADLAAVSDFVDEHDVTTIYTETLVSPAVARTVADETGASTAVLDPIEGLDESSEGDDYLSVMRANLQTLRRGQHCR